MQIFDVKIRVTVPDFVSSTTETEVAQVIQEQLNSDFMEVVAVEEQGKEYKG